MPLCVLGDEFRWPLHPESQAALSSFVWYLTGAGSDDVCDGTWQIPLTCTSYNTLWGEGIECSHRLPS